ncbi:MAG: hypothetical protein K0R18_1205 [Bacillales bacterium]|jgi:hypothetical protein|nr:hypothetical protein [Bacillales bacterium]
MIEPQKPIKKPKKRKTLKIMIYVFSTILLIFGVVFALNFQTIMLMSGKGKLKMNDIAAVKKAVSNSKVLSLESESTGADGTKTLNIKSKDNAVTIIVSQKPNKTQTISANIDANKLNTTNIDMDAIKSGDVKAVSAAKSLADDYLSTIVSKDQASGIEAYAAKEAISQLKNGNTNLSINNTFGSTNFSAKIDTTTGQINITVNN